MKNTKVLILEVGSLGGDWVMRDQCFYEKHPESSLDPCAVCGHGEKAPSVNQETGSHQTPNLLAL